MKNNFLIPVKANRFYPDYHGLSNKTAPAITAEDFYSEIRYGFSFYLKQKNVLPEIDSRFATWQVPVWHKNHRPIISCIPKAIRPEFVPEKTPPLAGYKYYHFLKLFYKIPNFRKWVQTPVDKQLPER